MKLTPTQKEILKRLDSGWMLFRVIDLKAILMERAGEETIEANWGDVDWLLTHLKYLETIAKTAPLRYQYGLTEAGRVAVTKL